MPPENNIQSQIDEIKKDIKALNDEMYRNNFSSRQDFNKASSFTTKLKVPHYLSVPITGEVGEVIEVGGKLYVCSSPNTFTIVGTQT